jgi:hypothetical protein
MLILCRSVQHFIGLVEPRAFLRGRGRRALVVAGGEEQKKQEEGGFHPANDQEKGPPAQGGRPFFFAEANALS